MSKIDDAISHFRRETTGATACVLADALEEIQSRLAAMEAKREGLLSCGHPADEMVRNQVGGFTGINCPTCTDACREWDKRNGDAELVTSSAPVTSRRRFG